LRGFSMHTEEGPGVRNHPLERVYYPTHRSAQMVRDTAKGGRPCPGGCKPLDSLVLAGLLSLQAPAAAPIFRFTFWQEEVRIQ
jgi:hypothetical protein